MRIKTFIFECLQLRVCHCHSVCEQHKPKIEIDMICIILRNDWFAFMFSSNYLEVSEWMEMFLLKASDCHFKWSDENKTIKTVH